MYSSKCTVNVGCLTHPTYDSSKSSTYQKDGEDFKLPFPQGDLIGYVSEDLVKIGDDISTTMSFGEITTVKFDTFDNADMSGILGLGYDTLAADKLPTFFDDLDISDKSFSFYPGTLPNGSYMTIPGSDSENYSDISTHPVVDQSFWTLNLQSLAQGDKKIDASAYNAIIITGDAVMIGPEEITLPLIDGIKVDPRCNDIESLPDLTVTIDETDYVFSPEDYVMKVDDPKKGTVCYLGIMATPFPSSFPNFILGDVFLRKYPATFSLNDNTVTFQEAKTIE